MGLMNLLKIKRRRNGKYSNPQQSHKQTTISYTVPDDQGSFIQICKKTFMDIFKVSQKRITVLINKKKMGLTTYSDQRTSHKKSKFTGDDRKMVREHILSFPRVVSHYSRAKTEKEYLSPDLNVHRMFKAYLKKHPTSHVSYKYYKGVFKKDFPKLSFHHPRVDTCHTCDRLNIESKLNNSSGRLAKQQLELHHRKVERSLEYMKTQITNSQLPGSNTSCISFDLQQVMFVPTLTHSDMFYLSQLSCYNLGIHVSDTNKAFMCMWHEGVSGRGSNQVTSCLLKILNMPGVVDKRHVQLWSDNCAGQNKNKVVLFLLIFLASHGLFDSLEYNFLVSGHSFMACDRDFALIEKRKRVTKAHVPRDLHEIVRSAKYNPPFEVIDMETAGFWDFKQAADSLLNTKVLNISKLVRIKITSDKPTIVKVKETFSEIESWREVNVLKKGLNISHVKQAVLNLLPPENKISETKKKSLTSMITYLESCENKDFYRKLLNIDNPSDSTSVSGT